MLVFLVKTLICSSLFYGMYFLLLRKETYFKINRFYLLAGLILAIVIPLINISIELQDSRAETFFYSLISGTKEFLFVHLLDEVVIYGSRSNPLTPVRVLEVAYIIGIGVFFALRIPLFLFQIIKLHQKSRKYKLGRINLYVHNQPYAAFSFWNSVYVNRKELKEKDFKVIWKHEIQHIKLGHTVESFLLEIWCCIFWFNPLVWMTKQRLKEIHEFQTDSQLIQAGVNTAEYQKYLLTYALGNATFSASSNFASISIKRRIAMLSSKQSSWQRHIKFIFLIPILFLMFSAFVVNFVYKEEDNLPTGIINEDSMLTNLDTVLPINGKSE